MVVGGGLPSVEVVAAGASFFVGSPPVSIAVNFSSC